MKAKHTLPLVLLCVLALVMAMAASCGGSSVPADQAQIEMTYTGDGVSYVGDREIIEGGPATVTVSNETSEKVLVVLFRFETGSDELAKELDILPEGSRKVRREADGNEISGTLEDPNDFLEDAWPGSNSYTIDLQADSTYLFDVAPSDYVTKGVWRAAVIEAVAK